MCAVETNPLDPPMTDCPHCNAKNSLEGSLSIELDDVAIRDGLVVAFTPGHLATNPSNGMNTHLDACGVYIACRECGAPIDAQFPEVITAFWPYIGAIDQHLSLPAHTTAA
jgi:hypothetical protein